MTARRRPPWKLSILLALVITGIVGDRLGLFDWREAVVWAQEYAGHWWLPPILVAGMVLLFTFGLPGSTLFWVVGILYAPVPGTLIVVAGGLLGGLGAYLFAGSLGGQRARDQRQARLFRFLHRRGDFLTLAAVRTLPTFPHSAINFSAGVLEIPLSRFLLASTLGLVLKGALYVTAIHNAATLGAVEEALSWRVAAPLLGVAVLFLVAAYVRERWGLARATSG